MTPLRSLSAAELDILRGAARGLSSVEQAAQRGVSPWTIKTQRKAVLAKLRARNMAHAITIAHDRGLLGDAPAEKMNPKQRAAFHARARDVDLARGSALGTTKREAHAAVSRHFGRELTSSSDYTYEEASWALDWLDEQLAAAALGLETVKVESA